MGWQKSARSRSISRIAVAATFALATASACGSSDTFSSSGAGGAAAGSGGSGNATGGGTGGVSTAGAGGTAGVSSGGAAGSGTAGSGTAGAGGAVSTCGTCDGCCVGSTCVAQAQQSWQKCGTQGSVCTSCAYGIACDSGNCTDQLDPAAPFHIVVDSVDIQATKQNGYGWDLPGDLPDPMVCFDDGQGTHGCTNYCSNQTSCSYSAGDGTVASSGAPVNFSGASLSGMTMVVYDFDPTTSNDLVGTQKLQLKKFSSEYIFGQFDQVNSVSFHLAPGQ